MIHVEWRETESMAQSKTWDHGKLLNVFYLEQTKEGLETHHRTETTIVISY